MHHPSDVLGGALYGSLIGWLLSRLLSSSLLNEFGSPEDPIA
jgi:membrane-associated phospholipid phosphatase